MLQVILNKPGKQYFTKLQLFGLNFPSPKLSKKDEPDMQDTGGEVRMKS